MGRLDGKIALVVGASRGIGAAIAHRFASEGANLVLGSRSATKLDATVASDIREKHPNVKVISVACDVTKEEDIKNIVNMCVEEFGKLDIAVNNAGVLGELRPVEDFDGDEYDLIFGTNVKATFFCCQYEIQAMKKTYKGDGDKMGSIVNISSCMSTAVLLKAKGYSVYAASKAAMEMITKYTAMENAKVVRVNSVNPGVIKTDMTSMLPPEAIGQFQFIGRFGKPEEIASLVSYLSSDDASLITGAMHVADGGWSLT